VLTTEDVAPCGTGLRPGGRRYCRVSALILDAGALVAVDREDREDHAMIARLRDRSAVRTGAADHATVVAQVWRGRHGRQVNLARLLRAVDVRAVSQRDGCAGCC
jgi:uncharacterized protein with PIN domain